jgi:hypothetical protein
VSRGFLNELRQRNVFKVALGYLVLSLLAAQIMHHALQYFAAPSWTMQAFVITLAVGFPIALVISWAFELTPKGVVLESQVDRTIKFSLDSGQRLDFSILLILSIIIIFMGLERFVFSGRDGGLPEPSQTEFMKPEPAQSADLDGSGA